MNPAGISFSFGENWMSLVDNISRDDIESAISDIKFWMPEYAFNGKTVMDVGSGSGIHSLAFFLLGVKEIFSFDYDPKSVEATTIMRNSVNQPENWKVRQGSILDKSFIEDLPLCDIVYSWGVLHHTGNMWKAIENAAALIKPGGLLFISIYKKGPNYKRDLKMKQKYNTSSPLIKFFMERRKIAGLMKRRLLKFKNPFNWNEKKQRGMNVYNDIVDWLGGLPYETATEDEIVRFLRPKNLVLERIKANPESTCSVYLFSKNK